MKTYVKIMGPPLGKALKELEKIAIDMPEVCFMSGPVSLDISPQLADDLGGQVNTVSAPRIAIGPEYAWSYFRSSGVSISRERCNTVISRSGVSIGDYDFYFEWFKKPTMDQLKDLMQRIDDRLTPLGCKYSLTSKGN